MSDDQITIEVDDALLEHNLKSDKIMLYIIALHWFIATAVTSIQYSTYQFGFFSGGLMFLMTFFAYQFYHLYIIQRKHLQIQIGMAHITLLLILK